MRNMISTLVLVAGFVVAAPVLAAEQNGSIERTQTAHQFLGKRPYAQPVVAKADSEQPWIGATLVVESNNERAVTQQIQKLHMLSKRPY